MTEETLIKYLEFLKNECLRHQNDNIISDDEINQLKIEIKRFENKIKTAFFNSEIKQEISKMDFNLEEENHNRSKYKWFSFIGSFQGKEIQQQENRKQRFLKLYNDLDTSIFKIKSIL
ncbi:MAG: hypothetical protein V3V28_00150 [Polaribacter sp.]|uniref:hypothetical protein n=1 Tax=Polaribacter sp. TaxID=1920175 RepID=UPI002F35A870